MFLRKFSENVCSPESFRETYVVKQTQMRRGNLQKLVVFTKIFILFVLRKQKESCGFRRN
jgi:hypothetical protein